MSKMNELSVLLGELIETGEKLISIAEQLKEYYSSPAESTPKEQAPEPENQITLEEVRQILAAKSCADDGKYKSEVKALVAKYSETGTLKGVPESSYAAVIAEAEVIGNG